ncbi:histone family protein [Candidatus Woesearchaeota archaeon]|nr:histone family protein [Candidatus Woesearchaeota archaeon]
MAKRENIIPFEPVGRLIQDSGAERVSQDAKAAMADFLTEYALKIGELAVKYARHAGRNTVTEKDIRLAEKNFY